MNSYNIRNEAFSEEKIKSLAWLFGVFGDVTRLKILFALSGGEKNVGEIADELGMNISAISHQLNILKRENLISPRRCGKTMCYSLTCNHVQDIISYGFEHITEEGHEKNI